MTEGAPILAPPKSIENLYANEKHKEHILNGSKRERQGVAILYSICSRENGSHFHSLKLIKFLFIMKFQENQPNTGFEIC